MMLLRANLKKDSLRGLLTGFLLMAPAAFLSPVRSLLLIDVGELRIQPFATFLLIVVAILFSVYLAQLGRQRKGKRVTLMVLMVVGMISVTNLLISESRPATLGYLANCFAPLLAAALLIHFDRKESFEASLRVFSIAFLIYLVLNLATWILVFNLKLPASTGLSYARMGGPFSESVTLGYAIAALCPVILFQIASIKDMKARAVGIPIAVLILFVSVMATGTRGGIFLLTIYASGWLLKRKRYGLIISLVLMAILINPVRRFGLTIDRLRSLTDEMRTSTYVAGIKYWMGSELGSQIVGYGFGSVYPYYPWTLQNEYSNNVFFLGPNLSIVQPHNSFIWFLVEAGLISLVASLLLIIFVLRHVLALIRSRDPGIDKRKASSIFFFTIFVVIVNNLDAILVIFPSISFVSWYILIGVFTFRHSLFMNTHRKPALAVIKT